MVKPFEEAAFTKRAMYVNNTGTVKTEFGYHIVKRVG